MSETITLAIKIVVFWFISMYTVEFAAHVARDYQVKEVKEFTIQQIADNGGYTDEVASKVKDKMNAYGLDQSIYKLITPIGPVNYQETFNVEIAGTYTYKSFNLLGSGIGNFKVLVKDKGTGIGHVYFR